MKLVVRNICEKEYKNTIIMELEKDDDHGTGQMAITCENFYRQYYAR